MVSERGVRALCNYNIIMSRFPSVGRDQKVKERGWDDRHHNQGMPDYSPLKDKHTKSYRKMLGHQKKQEPVKVANKGTTYPEKRALIEQQLLRVHPQSEQALQAFRDVATKHKLPDYYVYYSLLNLLGPHADPTQNLFAHQQAVQTQTSHYHRISTALQARQESLTHLTRELTTPSQLSDNIAQTINNYRSMTENVIDEVKRWRDSLGRHPQRPIFYTSANQNCLLALLNDSRSLGRAPLTQGVPFADKNDPFLLVPVKRSEGKQKNQLAEALQLPHSASHYQKYMEYLATERAQQLAKNPMVQAEPVKHPTVYTHNPVPVTTQQQKAEPDDMKRMELVKVRQDRLKKNQERIKSIKNIYQKYNSRADKHERHYHSERKGVQTDTQQRRRPHKKNQLYQQEQADNTDVEFEAMVKQKLLAERSKPRRLESRSKSSRKLSNKKEDKMIESLKDIQSTLKSKLQGIQQEEKTVQLPSPQPRRTNANLIQQLKQEIMAKIEKEASEKDKAKKARRQQEEKALEDIKSKLKREMEEKLESKKKEKLIEREQLQRKLKEEEERLGKQRQLQIQLQLKLTKEKQLRELEKIRREALERERKFKEQLQKQQAMRVEKEQIAEREKREKERLIEELKKKELREQLESELRDEISKGKGAELNEAEAGEQARRVKQAELEKELELLKAKEGVEVELFKKENELKKRMLELKQGEEELKRKQIEQLMREAIQTEKDQLQREAEQRRIELEESMRANVKEQLLQEHQVQTRAHLDQIQAERQQQLEEEVYRDKIRDKIEREMRMEAIQRTQKELQKTEEHKYEMKTKLKEARSRLEKEVTVDKHQIEEEVRRDMIERVIFDKQAEKEAAKNDLRMQFEKELLASAGPTYQPTTHSVVKKDISALEEDNHLTHKLKELGPTNQKPVAVAPARQSSLQGPSQLKDSMTLEQLHVYHKQKDKVSEIADSKIAPLPPDPNQEEGFVAVRPTAQKSVPTPPPQQAEYEVKIIRKDSRKEEKSVKEKESPKKQRKSKRKPKKQYSSDSDSEAPRKRQKKPKKMHYYEEESLDSEDQVPKKRHHKKPRRRQNSEEESEDSKKRSPEKSKPQRKQKEDSKAEQGDLPIETMRKPAKRDSGREQEARVVHFDAERESSFKPVEPVRMVPQKVLPGTDKFRISLQAIPEDEFDEYLSVHFGRVPQLQLSVQMHNRQDLYRKLINELTFCMLIGQEDGRVVGMALAYHDRNRADLRKFSIIHIATYRHEDLQPFVLSVTGFIFRKDPADEIEMHYRFDEREEDQLGFSQSFNKWFDKHGSVFQKRVEEGLYERKYLLKRQFNQKCEVVLGGINKNTFRNLFSVYSGVLMSETDMVALKDALVDTLAPQQTMSYAVMVAELFRTYLTPDEAEVLKNKVKEIAKLKEMLVLVVMMQKKKLRLDELKLYEFKNLIELNMKLMSQGKQIIRHCKDGNSELNRLYYAELSNAFNLPFHFQTTSLPLSTDHAIRHISYFRLSPLPPQQLHIVKSSLYNAELNLLPTEHSKYKLMLIDAAEYLELKESNNLDLFMYIRLFLKNVRSHNVAVWKYVWMPEMSDQAAWNLREFRSFLNKDFYAHDAIHISYRQFLPGALIIQPEHRDLVVTPPFIVGVMSMNLEQVSEGSPLYARLITLDALRTIQVEEAEAPADN